MSRKKQSKRRTRRVDDDDFKSEVVQMLIDGHSAQSIVERLTETGKVSQQKSSRNPTEILLQKFDHNAFDLALLTYRNPARA